MIVITTNMGVTEVLEDTKLDVFKTWDRVKTNVCGFKGTVLISGGSFTSVILDNTNESQPFLQSEITKIDERPIRLSFESLVKCGYDFGMVVFDLTLEDGTVVEWCYKKERKFLEVSPPHRQFGFWQVDYVIPHFTK